MKVILKIGLAIFLFLGLLTSCDNFLKVGNVTSLRYPIETPLRTKVVRMYIDTLTNEHGYRVPPKWFHADKLVNLDSVNFKRVYFKETPEEMYLLSYQGMLVLADVYNPEIREGSWVAEKKYMPKEEEERIKKRFKQEILDKIERMAKEDGLPDSLIYKSY